MVARERKGFISIKIAYFPNTVQLNYRFLFLPKDYKTSNKNISKGK